MTTKLKKKQKLRNNEYYDLQNVFDELYQKSKQNYKFKRLLEIITSEQNILLAYRNIKKNKGSKTSGTNKRNIIDIGKNEPQKLIEYVRYRLNDFKPHLVKRVEIEKDNGKIRPLGIPTIEDRLIQQCIKQVLEPICEAKFYQHSYGFRPNRSTHHAIARAEYLTNLKNFQYVVDIDIKGFFDNVNHSKLLKQMWTLGIHDKNLICVMSKMLKAEIKDIGIMNKGVPQGGILSPLLSNIVLNELDWWIVSQWEEMKTRHQYIQKYSRMGALRKNSKLKEVFIVRYADDFKLYCKDRSTADKMFIATQKWLKDRLDLEINTDKSGVVNLKKNYSEFLGIKSKWRKKGNKQVVKSYMTNKAIKKSKSILKENIKMLKKQPSLENANKYNATVLGLHNYYKIATGVSVDFRNIAYDVRKSLEKIRFSKNGNRSRAYNKFYGGYTGKTINVSKITLFPISYIRNSPPRCFSQGICNYTAEGRKIIHDKLQKVDYSVLKFLMTSKPYGQTIECVDNRISLYIGQEGKCAVTGQKLAIHNMELHHKIPRNKNGDDKYENLILVKKDVHKLIHATRQDTIDRYLKMIKCKTLNHMLLNQLRNLVGNSELIINK